MNNKSGRFIVTRHHESVWNKTGRWTGIKDVGLTEYGKEMAVKMGKFLKGQSIDRVVCSDLIRTHETLNGILKGMEVLEIPIQMSSEFKERDYGDYTGKNKAEMEKIFGKEKYNCVRREWDCEIPNGETLKMVFNRMVPYYQKNIIPDLVSGQNILLVSHGNTIRALIKYIENIPDTQIRFVEMPLGTIIFYEVDEKGLMLSKELFEIE